VGKLYLLSDFEATWLVSMNKRNIVDSEFARTRSLLIRIKNM
jgi:hypothetical protein